jgi:hypothetical protein
MGFVLSVPNLRANARPFIIENEAQVFKRQTNVIE